MQKNLPSHYISQYTVSIFPHGRLEAAGFALSAMASTGNLTRHRSSRMHERQTLGISRYFSTAEGHHVATVVTTVGWTL